MLSTAPHLPLLHVCTYIVVSTCLWVHGCVHLSARMHVCTCVLVWTVDCMLILCYV